jgi:hypothetical protein
MRSLAAVKVAAIEDSIANIAAMVAKNGFEI